MDRDVFTAKLKAIADEANDKIVELVRQAREENSPDGANGLKGVNFADDPNWQRAADRLAEQAGWIYDRMQGRNSRESMTRKLRRALGYTYP